MPSLALSLLLAFCQSRLSRALQSQVPVEAQRRLHQELFQPKTQKPVGSQIDGFSHERADDGGAANAAVSHRDDKMAGNFAKHVNRDGTANFTWRNDSHENSSATVCADNLEPQLENGTIKCVNNASRGSYVAPPADYIFAGYWPLLREDGAAEFVNKFSPTRLLSSEAWDWLPSHVAFNPALVSLPSRLARSLHPLARYIVAVRHGSGQCDRLGKNNDTTMRGVDPLQDSSILLLDASLNPLTLAARLRGTDMRLFVVGEQIVATFVHLSNRCHIRLLDLWIDPTGTFRANYILHDGVFDAGARNVGLMTRNGTDGPELLALWWLGDNTTNGQNDVRPIQNLTTGKYNMIRKKNKDAAYRPLHNSINLVYLPEEEAYLAVGHQHYKYNQNHLGIESEFARFPRYGHNYVHHFLLIDREPPFATKYMSPAFCVPAARNSSTCETVQFITSAIRDGDDLLLSYGINDCEAGIFRVPLRDVLAFTQRHAGGRLGFQA